MMNGVVRHVRRLALMRPGEGPTDAELLDSFLVHRDETAFEALLRRHGPMVLGVCRRVLRHAQDAEDAFQATFLVLARKAGSLRSRELLGSWLYGIAYRTAMKARAMRTKRQVKERRVGEQPELVDLRPNGLLAELDEALARLPEKYRVPVVLCELEGWSRKEVAQRLGVPEGTLSWRLAHAKKLLAERLSTYGAAAVVAAVTGSASRACVPPLLLSSTAKAAVQVAAGKTLSAGVASTIAVKLSEGVIKAMFFTKLKAVYLLVLAALVSAGAIGLGYRAAAAPPGQAGATRPVADELEELRLEVAALRKGLEATRTRVKTLESELQTLKGRAATGTSRLYQDVRAGKFVEVKPANDFADIDVSVVEQPDAPLTEAEAALKKLRANPEKKQAVDALEKALNQRNDSGGNGTAGNSAGAAKAGFRVDLVPVIKENNLATVLGSGFFIQEPKRALAEAEAALKKLQTNPKDKQALDNLANALKQLKDSETGHAAQEAQKGAAPH
jgi:RNA polymerase sigma factor (sigma-70 family)